MNGNLLVLNHLHSQNIHHPFDIVGKGQKSTHIARELHSFECNVATYSFRFIYSILVTAFPYKAIYCHSITITLIQFFPPLPFPTWSILLLLLLKRANSMETCARKSLHKTTSQRSSNDKKRTRLTH